MRIAISGSVGSGKTSFSEILGAKLGARVFHLNEFAAKYKTKDVEDLQTFDFDFELLEKDLSGDLAQLGSYVVEGHFAHLLDPALFDKLLIINRPLELLKDEYKKRNYNEKKTKENLEVESFNLCFYEALEEGFEEEQVISFNNDSTLKDLLDVVMTKL